MRSSAGALGDRVRFRASVEDVAPDGIRVDGARLEAACVIDGRGLPSTPFPAPRLPEVPRPEAAPPPTPRPPRTRPDGRHRGAGGRVPLLLRSPLGRGRRSSSRTRGTARPPTSTGRTSRDGDQALRRRTGWASSEVLAEEEGDPARFPWAAPSSPSWTKERPACLPRGCARGSSTRRRDTRSRRPCASPTRSPRCRPWRALPSRPGCAAAR